MTSNIFQLKKAHCIDIKQSLPGLIIDVDFRNHATEVKSRSHGHLNRFLHRLFGRFTRKEKKINSNAYSENAIVRNISEMKDDETQLLLDLENCADVARTAEACGLYEWINKSDE